MENKNIIEIPMSIRTGNANAFGGFIRNQIIKYGQSWKIVGYTINPEIGKTTMLSSVDNIIQNQAIIASKLNSLSFDVTGVDSQFLELELSLGKSGSFKSSDIKDSSVKCVSKDTVIFDFLQSEIDIKIVLYFRRGSGQFNSKQNSTFLKNIASGDSSNVNYLYSNHADITEITFTSEEKSYDEDLITFKIFNSDLSEDNVKEIFKEVLDNIITVSTDFRSSL